MQRKRTVGNNYSGPRWAFAGNAEPKREQPGRSGGLTMMGGSNRKPTIRHDDVDKVTHGPSDVREQAETALRDLNSRPLVVNDYDVFVELRCEVEKLEELIQRKAEEYGVSDPGAATAAELLLEMRAAVDAFPPEMR